MVAWGMATRNPETDQADFSLIRNPRILVPAAIMAGTFLLFQPTGLDQFLFPKFLLLLLGLPALLWLEISSHLQPPFSGGDALSNRLALLFFLTSAILPRLHVSNAELHGFGILEFLVMLLLFRAGAALGSREEQESLIFLICISAIPIAALALLQGMGWDPMHVLLGLHSTRAGRWQMLTTLGHPSWTAELLVLLLPPGLLLLRKHASAARVAALFIACAVILSGSRGGMLVLALVLWISYRQDLLSAPSTRWGKLLLTAGALLPAGALVILFRLEPGRLLALAPLSGRLGLWEAGLHLISFHPFSGSGLHHTSILLPEGLRAIVASAGPGKITGLPTVLVDRLDNDLLQMTLEGGLLSCAFVVFLVARSIRILRSRLRRSENQLDRTILSSLIAFGLFSLFSSPFHTPSSALIFWLFLGLATRGSRVPEHEGPPVAGRLRRVGVLLAAVLSVVILLFVVLPALRDNHEAGTAHRLLHRGDFSRSAAILAPITDRAPWLPGAAIDRARALVKLHRPEESLAELRLAERWISSAWIWRTRALALEEMGLDQEARKTIKDGLDVLPRSPTLLEAQALLEAFAPSADEHL